jgi:hypothetical protein
VDTAKDNGKCEVKRDCPHDLQSEPPNNGSEVIALRSILLPALPLAPIPGEYVDGLMASIPLCKVNFVVTQVFDLQDETRHDRH